MKKFIAILCIILAAIGVALGVYTLVNKSKDGRSSMSENDALQIAKIRYEFLLDYANGKGLDFELDGDTFRLYQFESKEYAKINNFDDMIKETVTNEYLDEFCSLAKIIKKDEAYYMDVDNIDREEDLAYGGSTIVIKNFSDEQIDAEIVSTYKNYSEDEISEIKQKFIMKKDNGEWKANEFALPY